MRIARTYTTMVVLTVLPSILICDVCFVFVNSMDPAKTD